MKTVESCETKIYACSSGVPTISVGYALLINGKDGWDIRKKLFAEDCDFVDAGITLPSEDDIKKIEDVLDDVMDKLKDKDVAGAKKLVTDNSTTLNKFTITEAQSKELFKILQEEYEGYLIERIRKKASVTKDKAKEILETLSTNEQIALFSTCYTRLTVIGGGVSNAVKNYVKDGISEKDKAYYKTEAWYEIRYNSHKSGWKYINKKKTDPTATKIDGDDGQANRRYKDSLKFGLYGLCTGTQKDLSQDTKDGILKFLKSESGRGGEVVEETIKKYEKEFSPAADALGTKKQDSIETIIKALETKDDPVEQIEKEVEAKGKKLDNLSLVFLKKYHEKHTLVLDKERPVYNAVSKIKEHSDVLIFPLMDRLVVTMEKEEAKAKDKDDELYCSIREFRNRCKAILEETIKEIGNYKKPGYKQDNDSDLTDYNLKQELITAFEPQKFGSPDTKKSHEFFKSFITEKDEAKEKAEKEKEEQKKREEERILLAKEKEWKEARYKKEREKMRKEGEEAAKKRDGWIIVGCKLYNRKDYYGV
ncbi:hypothetical protein [Halocella sp. SP3-1]|uniref:hypothetical protein n=1 Tax=Halocella sp. SP3-1 TaxID=2382161 RepID=UPI00197AA06C|nr:hypothetical protein [Halocella sp. SP3-1]